MIENSRLYLPDPARAARTNCGSIEAFQALLARSHDDPDAFWADVAGELEWTRRWDTVREGDFPHVKYFVGGITNPTLNLLDRHVAQGNGNRVALIWEGEDGQARFFTYRMLLADVNRCANVLRRLGVGKGDAVAIFTPNLSEAVIAVLACFRIGALFNTVFSGFSAHSLRDRLESYQPKVVVTADGAFRRGKIVPLKDIADAAIADLPGVEAMVVIRRTGTSVDFRDGSGSLVARSDAGCVSAVRSRADGSQRSRHRLLHERDDRQAKGHRSLGRGLRRQQLHLREVPPRSPSG